MRHFIEICSTDNTDILVFVDKILCVQEKEDGTVIFLENGDRITSGAEFKDIKNVIKRLK